MTRPVEYPGDASHRPFIRIEEPIVASDLFTLFARGQRLLTGTPASWYVLIHGIPCDTSPEWEERHPGEASEGVATYPYRISRATAQSALTVAITFSELGKSDPAFERVLYASHSLATNWANLAIGATTEDCWQEVIWIDIVDTEGGFSPVPVQQPLPSPAPSAPSAPAPSKFTRKQLTALTKGSSKQSRKIAKKLTKAPKKKKK